MKLEHPFIQLPLKFDAERLLDEIEAIGESAWLPHPEGFPGNDALTLITPGGINNNNELSGQMRPTKYLEQCPYMLEVLQTIGGVWGRTRLMRLSGQAEVNPHVDVHYYWRERMRVHVPIVTQPSVRFYCGDQDINMAPGECWIFDTWRLHRVINDASRPRIHLVADTVGSEQFFDWYKNAKPAHVKIAGWEPKEIPRLSKDALPIRFESVNIPNVMSPWEIREHFTFLFNEAVPHPGLDEIARLTFSFCASWHSLWIECGDNENAYHKYRKLRDAYLNSIPQLYDLKLKNGNGFINAIGQSLIFYCVKDDKPKPFQEIRSSGQAVTQSNDIGNHVNSGNETNDMKSFIQKPLILVSSPRSGSTMFYEALEKCSDLYSIGGESHGLIESISALHPSAKNYDSNILGSSDCNDDIVKKLRQDFYDESRKNRGVASSELNVIRLLEKTPKNALRIPFMRKIFPDATFLYLHRNPRQVISSMIDAWESGRFKTYVDLPGWTGLPWSLLLVPGWRNFIGKPLHHIVAHQWSMTTKILLDDLESIDPKSVQKIRYEAFISQPEMEMTQLCKVLSLQPNEKMWALPLSRYTLTPPHPDKWKRNEHLISEIWPLVEEQALRAEKYLSA
jgi:Sulfotransferase family/Aspartyl/Asparaginyl beta-hydroxylase